MNEIISFLKKEIESSRIKMEEHSSHYGLVNYFEGRLEANKTALRLVEIYS